jgi:Ca-activated chloride channel homolog
MGMTSSSDSMPSELRLRATLPGFAGCLAALLIAALPASSVVRAQSAPPGPLHVPAASSQPGPATARIVPQQQEQQPGAIHVTTSLVLLDVTVKDHAGRIVDGLTLDDFQVSEDGQPQTVSYFGRYQLPLAVALVVDLSESITPFLRPLRYATSTALRTLKADDQVALFTFSTQVDRRVSLTSDKHAIADQLETFSTGGATNINGAIFDAARYLEQEAPPTARRVIVLVSDNVGTEKGGVSSRSLEDAVLEADAGVFSLRVPGDNPLAVRVGSKFILNVAKLTEATGGDVFEVQKEGSLYIAFESLIQRLKTRYTVGFIPAHAGTPGHLNALKVTLSPSHGVPGKDYTVIAKKGYFAARGASQ